MQYRYQHARELHRLSNEQLQREYEHVHFPFRYCFNGRDGHGNASYLPRADGNGVEITFDTDGPQSVADELIAEFLNCWNNMVPGLAVAVVDSVLPAHAPGPRG
jgi:hypothetical protein